MSIPKFTGRDCEVSTTGIDAAGRPIDAGTVTREILARVPAALEKLGATYWSRDLSWRNQFSSHAFVGTTYREYLRIWSSAGQCFYPDMGHVELCTPSCLGPRTLACHALAVLTVAEEARRIAEEEADDGVRYALSASNADILDPAISFGSHINVTVEEPLWDMLLVDQQRPAVLGWVASGLAAAVPFFGAGHLLPLKDGATVYSLSARAHHVSRMATFSTTQPFERGLLNSRREPHGEDHQRLHLIAFDFAVLPEALLCSFLQCLLAAAEEGCCRLNLYDPVRAMRTWSWGLDHSTGKLEGRAMLTDGRWLTLPEYMGEITAELLRMCESGLIPPRIAPGAADLLPRIADLARYAAEGSLARCARHLTWASKLLLLTELCRRESLDFGDPAVRLADHDYLGTDPRRGAFWKLWDAGVIDPLVQRESVLPCLSDGPPESRDWARGRLVRRFRDDITDVDWSYVQFRRTRDLWGQRFRIDLPHLESLNRAAFETIIDDAEDVGHLEELLDRHAAGVARQFDPVSNITPLLASYEEET
ncbi:MAG: proteasome accessory factor PafA2 family protein [Pirellulales bacterium]|nr:proteasome accessory factor PafA2 family protein [Pirellulales bacterium]